ncbi:MULTISPECIES: PilW family protein [Shewanella]|uniref:PilW family protein n=2 Tax=Shewanella indica TaxID=768528 RepID=A0ABU4QC43_9GAMM|nr:MULTISPECIES: PilW family protein [Shewanella]MDX6014906.1 PilW family protein [Shewanella indica]NDO74106.1 prepilin-type N-terminal cleavage/methylation domain-containing protein [Shewanella sp. SE1]BCV37469.1 type IV minor pilin protein PilW [Shewanella chilikensis]
MSVTNSKQSGFSLVELMVAMVISLFLTLGLFAMFSMSATNVTTTGQFNQLQENGRIALAIMVPDLSQVGFFGDMTGTDFVLGTNTRVDNTVGTDCTGEGLNNATLPNDKPAHFRRLWGYEAGVSTGSLSCVSSVIDRTDVIQIKRLVGPPGTGGGFRVATTASQAVFFNDTDPALENQRVWEYQHHVYFIKDNNGVPVLTRKSLSKNGMDVDEPLVEGIENMRILYGFDEDGDDTADSFMPVQSVTDLMWDNQLFQRIVALRVFLLVRSVAEDKAYTNENTYQIGDKTITYPRPDKNDNVKPDHFRRKVVSTTVVLENPVLIRN